jgi:DNA-binding response OmpR family regulator
LTSPKKILIAEDELLIAKVLKLVLEKKQFEVMHVTDGEAAEEKAMTFKPDVILLDVFLKNNTCGIDVAQNLREKGENCPIIFTTGNSYEQTTSDIKNISNCHLMIKPIDIDQLLDLMQEMHSITG